MQQIYKKLKCMFDRMTSTWYILANADNIANVRLKFQKYLCEKIL
jgi:hypothetical protein